jgi:alanine dehydrogenase
MDTSTNTLRFADAPLLLSRADVRELLSLDDCIEAVEAAFIAAGRGQAPAPRSLGFPVAGGGFHVKAATLSLDRPYFAAKLNGNFPGNRVRHSLPTIQGLVLLSDATNGTPLAILDSIEITILRTGAATGVAARRLARADASSAAILGCGNQGRVSLDALARVRTLKRAFVWDIDLLAAARLAAESQDRLGFPVEVTSDDERRDATRTSHIVVTCTPSKTPILGENDIGPGTFVAAVGADSETKHEIESGLMARAKVVTDEAEQCSRIGDLRAAIAAGVMRADQVLANLGEILCGTAHGRTSDDDIIVFDSTGTALQDVAAAAIVYERALKAGRGARHAFA